MTLILGIESSCDETGIAIYDDVNKKILSESLFSQIDIHQQYGGVMPEIASRHHLKKIVPLLQSCLEQDGILLSDIDIFSYTAGPGLNGALLVGTVFANALAFMFNKPSLPIHHLEGHILSPFLGTVKQIEYPYLVLLVSGGHTQLILVQSVGNYKIVGDTLDDAAGEAFDKTAKMLGFPYPGGVKIAQHALLGKAAYNLPRPMINSDNLDMSFSGLKTSCSLLIRDLCKQYSCASSLDLPIDIINDVAFAVEDAITDTLVNKSLKAVKIYKPTTFVVSGGVSANMKLRTKLDTALSNSKTTTFYPPLQFCTDNGAMIALAGAYRKCFANKSYICHTYPRWNLESLSDFYKQL